MDDNEKLQVIKDGYEYWLKSVVMLDGCYEWLGTVDMFDTPIFVYGTTSIVMRKLIFQYGHPEVIIAPEDRIKTTCKVRLCTRPDHLVHKVKGERPRDNRKWKPRVGRFI